MTKRTRTLPYCLMTALMLIAPLIAFSQPETTGTIIGPPAVTTESLTALAAEITSGQKEAAQLKTEKPDSEPVGTAAELLDQAVSQLQLRDKYASQTLENERIVREAPAALERVKAELKQDDFQTSAPVDLPSTATAEIVEQKLSAANAELAGLEGYLAQISDEQGRRSSRSEAIPRELVEAKQGLSQAEIAAAAGPGTDDPLVANARKLLARAHVKAAQARITSLETELARYNAREELLPLARQLINQRLTTEQAQVKVLSDKLTALRRTEATASARELKQAARQTGTSHSLVRAVAAENTSITSEFNLAALVESHHNALDQLQAIKEDAEQISTRYNSLTQKFESVGYSDSLGLLLQKLRKELPSLRSHRESLELRSKKLADANLKSLEIQDMVTALSDPEAEAVELAQTAGLDISTSMAQSVKREISSLLQARREYLLKMREAFDKYFQTLVELNASEEELVRQTSAYADFIDERILWLPSAETVSPTGLQKAWSSFESLARPTLWLSYARDFLKRGKDTPVLFIFGGILLLLIVASHRRWKSRLRVQLDIASRNRLASFSSMVRCLLDAALYVLPLPALMIAMGTPLANVYRVSVETSSLANGLLYGGCALFVLRLAQVVIQRRGIAEVFFVWPVSALGKLRRVFSVMVWIYVPAIILIRMWEFIGSDASMEAARVVLVIVLVAATAASLWLLNPQKSVLKGINIYRSSGFFYKLRYPLFFAISAIPAMLAVGAIMGYVYTSIQLSQRLNMSFWLGAAVLLFSETAFFWILVKRRRLAIDEARKRREAAKAQQIDSASQSSGEANAPAPEPTLDIAAISQQAGRLLRVFVLGIFIIGLWGVWASVLPALHYLDSQPLWSVTRQVSETSPDGTVVSLDKAVPVTVSDMLLVVLVLFGLVAALRNIPGLLDITIFQRLSVQPGERYAFNTLIRYIIILIAAVFIFLLFGLQWSQIQWLVAGVSVGLGFGLQEIFANFVSGLILLFERPVRVGDTVEVGGIQGTISQIRIRATTVVDWDHFEHIIPNKEMITKSVANWTLSNLKRRLMIHISVPFGCDYDKARDILLKVARDNPYVLDDPGPAAGIESITDNSVKIVVFAHLPNSDSYLDARHSLIAEFQRQLAAAGISIPYPHLDVRLERPAPSGKSPSAPI